MNAWGSSRSARFRAVRRYIVLVSVGALRQRRSRSLAGSSAGFARMPARIGSLCLLSRRPKRSRTPSLLGMASPRTDCVEPGLSPVLSDGPNGIQQAPATVVSWVFPSAKRPSGHRDPLSSLLLDVLGPHVPETLSSVHSHYRKSDNRVRDYLSATNKMGRALTAPGE